MSKKYINLDQIPFAMLPFIVRDTYDYNKEVNHISATTLLKPVKQLILGARVDPADLTIDATQLIASRLGNSVHDAIETTWKSPNLHKLLKNAGVLPSHVIDRIVVNPEETKKGDIPVYLELRSKRKLGKYTVHGKFDIVLDGLVEDFKTTSAWAYVYGRNTEQYKLQGSIYRWLNPEKITKDYMNINFVFTDWSRAMLRTEGYPKNRFAQQKIPLLSLEETERFLTNKLDLIEKNLNVPEHLLPRCNDEELWRGETTYKYYKNPEKRTRATRNFNNPSDAQDMFIKDGRVGIVVEERGEVKACNYCDGFLLCSQKDEYIASGELKLEA